MTQPMKDALEENEGGMALTVRRAANLPDETWSKERIGVILRTCCPPGTKIAELAMFLTVAARYDLDPILNEIWLAKDDRGKIRVLTGRATYLKVARRDPSFVGLISGVVHEKDAFTVTRDGDQISVVHEIHGFDRGKRVGAYCKIRMRDRPDVYVQRTWEQFKHLATKAVWQQYPDDMLETRAIVTALRFAYNITGMALPEEEVDDGGAPVVGGDVPLVTGTSSKLDEVRARLETLAAQNASKARGMPTDETIVDAPSFVDDDGVIHDPAGEQAEPGDAAE